MLSHDSDIGQYSAAELPPRVLVGFGGDWAAIWMLLAIVGMVEVSNFGVKWREKSIESKKIKVPV